MFLLDVAIFSERLSYKKGLFRKKGKKTFFSLSNENQITRFDKKKDEALK